MKLLLDTHTVLGFMDDSPRLSATAAAAIESLDNDVLLSAVAVVASDTVDPSSRLPESMTKHAAPTREWLSVREFLIGVTEDEFVRRVEAAGFNVRVVVRDGHSYARRASYDPKRINVEVADGRVSRIEGVG